VLELEGVTEREDCVKGEMGRSTDRRSATPSVQPASRMSQESFPMTTSTSPAAVEGRAAFVVTGDPDLLTLEEHAGVRVVSPRQFLDVLTR